MAFTYEDVTPTLIPNTNMRLRLRDGVPYQYLISASEGYVLHETGYDYPDMNDETIIHKGYTVGTVSCSVNYDFETNPREIYAVLRTDVPADDIFGGGNHEIM